VGLDLRDLSEIGLLALSLYFLLRVLGKTRGAALVRGVGLIFALLFLGAQFLVIRFGLTVLGKILDYVLATGLIGLIIVFQPELRRGLLVIGRYPLLQWFQREKEHPVADPIADALEALSRQGLGALIAIERENGLDAFVETGVRLNSDLSAPLLRAIFSKQSPLHDGAVILRSGRILAAACQLPLGPPPDDNQAHLGMRHRAALSFSDETDALLLVVSEETGKISIAQSGHLKAISRENASRAIAEALKGGPVPSNHGQHIPKKDPATKSHSLPEFTQAIKHGGRNADV
jgi:diadenylate cyclase